MAGKEEKFKQLIEDNKGMLLLICRYYAPLIEDKKDNTSLIFINANIPGQPYPGIL